jgi:hypothetical protein
MVKNAEDMVLVVTSGLVSAALAPPQLVHQVRTSSMDLVLVEAGMTPVLEKDVEFDFVVRNAVPAEDLDGLERVW